MDTVELAERDRALGRLRRLVLGGARTEGRVVLVYGEAGVGKTALVRAATAGLPATRQVLIGACDALSTPRPLGPLRDLAAELGDPVASALAGARPPHEVFAAVLGRLRAAPTVVVFEDVHWADEGTLDLLRYLGRRILTTPSILVLTYRDVELGPDHPLQGVIGDLVRSGATERIALDPLSLAGVAEIVGDLPLDPADVYEKSGGNPFFVSEVLAQPNSPVPDNVRDAVLGRTVGLGGTERGALELLSCAPAGIRDELAERLGITPVARGALVRRGLLTDEGGWVRFRHELGRLTVLDSLPAPRRRERYARLYDALAGSGDHALLVHLAQGAERGESVVEHAGPAAADAARAGAHRQAAAFLVAALEHAAGDRAPLLESLSRERYQVDEIEDAIGAMTEALQLRLDAGGVAEAASDLRWLSRLEWFCGRRAVAERHADSALALATRSRDERQIGFARGQLAIMAMTRGEPGPAREWAREALAVADRLGDDELRAPTLTTLGMAELMAGDDAGIRHIRDSITVAARSGLDEHAARALNNLSFYLVEARRLPEASEALEEGMRFTADRDLDTFHLYSLGMRARLRVQRGQWTAAWDDATTVLRSQPAPLNAMWPLWVRGVLGVRREDPGAVRSLEEAWTIASGFGELYRLVPIAAALAEHEWLTGDDVRGADRLAELAGRLVGTVGRWQAGEAATWLRRVGRDVPGGLDVGGTPYEAQLRGNTAAALRGWSELGMPYEHALTLVDCDRPEDLVAALERCHDLGATRTAGWIRRRLRRHGVASPPRGPRASTRANPAGLTARQMDVLGLVAGGLTNAEIGERLFISEKTAAHHVSAILTKLGVTSRRAAGRLAADLGVAPFTSPSPARGHEETAT